ncbi:hypothetical protein POM88_038024 [Heracleum sosnowskyi]|uniref:Small ribosomal subunit protein uS10 domain-containing protein n=1 Tax=Heracleum sosnowskyi TaxID=360622 RepID=A0AAD8HR74_9APIA|nr:hypothetical protein POM88_038024 [Heracleum sosnowskyi]
MEQPIATRFENLSLSSEPIESQFERILSLPSEKQQTQNIRFSVCSRFLWLLDEVVAAIIRKAKGMNLMVWGPHILPTEVVNLEYRLAPSREGLNLVRNVESQYHQRDIDVLGSNELVEQILSGVGQNHVTIYVEVVDLGVFLQSAPFDLSDDWESLMREVTSSRSSIKKQMVCLYLGVTVHLIWKERNDRNHGSSKVNTGEQLG